MIIDDELDVLTRYSRARGEEWGEDATRSRRTRVDALLVVALLMPPCGRVNSRPGLNAERMGHDSEDLFCTHLLDSQRKRSTGNHMGLMRSFSSRCLHFQPPRIRMWKERRSLAS